MAGSGVCRWTHRPAPHPGFNGISREFAIGPLSNRIGHQSQRSASRGLREEGLHPLDKLFEGTRAHDGVAVEQGQGGAEANASVAVVGSTRDPNARQGGASSLRILGVPSTSAQTRRAEDGSFAMLERRTALDSWLMFPPG